LGNVIYAQDGFFIVGFLGISNGSYLNYPGTPIEGLDAGQLSNQHPPVHQRGKLI
jgi:hypothetical protein